MKKWIITTISLSLIAGIAGWLYYKHDYKDTVASYYLIKYTPPVEEFDKPEIKVEKLQDYPNDTIAVRDQAKKEGKRVETTLKKAERDLSKPDIKGNALKYNTYLNVYEKLLSEERTLLRFTTTRKFDGKKFLSDFIKTGEKYGVLSKEMESLKNKYKVDMAIYPIK